MSTIRLDHVRPGKRPYLDLEFPDAPPSRPYVIFNMVGSIDGKAVVGETEQGLGSPDDKRRMQELRAHADAVMNGATTLRKSGASSRVRDPELVGWRQGHGKRHQPLGVILTRKGEFPFRGPYFQSPPDGLEAVILASDVSAERKAEIESRGPLVYPVAEGTAGCTAGLEYLRRERGVELLLCEGGPSTLRTLVDSGCADELFITLSPTLVGGAETLTIFDGAAGAEEEPRRLDLLSALVNEETSEVYLRYRFGQA